MKSRQGERHALLLDGMEKKKEKEMEMEMERPGLGRRMKSRQGKARGETCPSS